jgi:hypothetical protein
VSARQPVPDPDASKLRYSARIMTLSAGLFAVAGVIWLVSGNGVWIGAVFLVVAVLMAVAARAIAARAG